MLKSSRIKSNLFLIGLAVLLAWVFVSTNTLTSDSILTEALYKDLITGTPLSGWQIPNSLYLFPDWILWFSFRSIFSISSTFFYFSLILFFGILNWVKAQFDQEPLSFVKTILTLFVWSSFFRNEWWVFATPVHHGTAMVIGLWWSHYCLMSERLSSNQVISLSLIASLLIASDPIFGLWFLIPLFLVSVVYRLEIWKKIFLCFLILVLSYLCSYFFYFISGVSSGNGHHTLFVHPVDQSLILLTNYLSSNYGFLSLLCLSLVIFFKQRTKLNIFYAFVILSTFSFISISGMWRDSHSVRYLLPVSFILAVTSVKFLFNLTHKNLRTFLIGVLLIAGSINLIMKVRVNNQSLSEDIKSVKCIDENLAKYKVDSKPGLATYWAYKMNRVLSQKSLNMNQIHNNWTFHDVLFNSNWDPKAFAYSYLITTTEEKMVGVKHNKVSESINCGKYSLLLPVKHFYLFN